MRIAAAHLHPYTVPLRNEWRSAAGNLSVRCGWLLELADTDGRHGWGECAPLPSHGSEDFTAAEAALNDWLTQLPGRRFAEVLQALTAARGVAAPAARAAVECALLDLLAQAAYTPLDAFLGAANPARTVRCNTVAGSVHDRDAIDAAITGGFSVIKLKLGIHAAEDELAALQAIATRLPASVRLRLDANRAWDAATATRMLHALAELPVESVEEPLQVADFASLRTLQRDLPYPLALDESLADLRHAELFATTPIRRLVLKLAPLGGLLPALDLARRASAAGIDCVVTTGIDGACATLAAAHLASALDNGLAHGLATGRWLTETLGEMPAIAGEMLNLPTRSGLGYSMIESINSSSTPQPCKGFEWGRGRAEVIGRPTD